MAEKSTNNLTETVTVRPIGRIKKQQGFFQNPVVQGIVDELIVPLIKSSVLKIVERLLFGEQGDSGSRTGSGTVSYRDYFQQKRRYGSPIQEERFRHYQQVRSQFPALEDLVFRNEEEATMVINMLYDRIENYTYATVADLYEIVQLEVPDYTYVRFGWNQQQLSRYELRTMPSGGVRLVMPRPFPIQE